MFALVNYAADTDNLNYIDKTRIGATGHSAGGNAAIEEAAAYHEETPVDQARRGLGLFVETADAPVLEREADEIDHVRLVVGDEDAGHATRRGTFRSAGCGHGQRSLYRGRR